MSHFLAPHWRHRTGMPGPDDLPVTVVPGEYGSACGAWCHATHSWTWEPSH